MSEQRKSWAAWFGELAGWCAGGVWTGAVIGALSIRGNTSLQGSGQAWPFLAWVCLIYASALFAAGLLIAPLARRRRKSTDIRSSFVAASTAALFGMPTFALAQWTISQVNWRGPDHTLNLLVSVICAFVMLAVARFVLGPIVLRWSAGLATTAMLAPALVAVLVSTWGANTQPSRAIGTTPTIARNSDAALPRVLVIGIDGLDWDRLNPLIESGRCPNFARLKAESFHGPLATFEPTWSPIVWNTISTGVPMEEHGVLDFTELQIPGLDRGAQRLYSKVKTPAMLPSYSGLPTLIDALAERGVFGEVAISGLHRRAKAFWNVLSEQGIDVGVVRWWASWPAEEVRGFFVSDNDPLSHALSKSKMSVKDGEIAMAHMTSPPELARELIPLIAPPPGDARTSDEALEAILRDPILADLSADDIAELKDERVNIRWFDIIRRGDEFSTRAGLHLWREKRVSMCAVYLRAVDNLSHRMWRHTGVVDRTYEFTDARLGELLAATDANTTVMVVSDHGWCYEPGDKFAHNHAPPGVFMLRGPKVRAGAAPASSNGPTVFDVAPTVLALYGLPLQTNQRGRVWTEAFEPGAPALATPPAIPSWGAYQPRWTRSDARNDPEGRREAADLLRHLGYLD